MAKKTIDSRRPKIVYQWHKETKVYTGKAEAAPDPFSHDKWLMPIRSTAVEPPAKKNGYAIKMNEELGKWSNEKA